MGPARATVHVRNFLTLTVGAIPCGRDTRWVRMLAESHRKPGKHCRTGRYLFGLTSWVRADSRCDASCAGPSRRGVDSHWSPRADKRHGRYPTTAVRDGRLKPLARREFNYLHLVVVIVDDCSGAGLYSRQRCLFFAFDTVLAKCWIAIADGRLSGSALPESVIVLEGRCQGPKAAGITRSAGSAPSQ